MVHTRRTLYSRDSYDSTKGLIRLWLLRLLVPLGAHREFIGPHGMRSDTLAEAIGLAHWIAPGSPEFDVSLVRAELRQLHARAESEDRECRVPSALAANVSRLATLVGLSEAGCRILEFAVLIHTDSLLDDTADWLGKLPSPKVCHVLSVLLDLPEAELRSTLSTRGPLAQSGLVKLERRGTGTLGGQLNLLSDNFADRMLTAEEDPLALLRDTVSLSPAAELAIEDFGHVTDSLSVLRPYLRRALEARRRGVNVFLYGEPGSGKSQLARTLSEELGCELFEVASQDEDGDAVQGEQRLRAFRAAQSFFAQRRALILFDETEDVFDDGNGFFGKKSTAQTRKAWINRMLEENPVPTLWLSNSVGCLDPAFVRRFDLVMELSLPPKTQRQRIVHDACGDMLTPASLSRIAAAESLAPAVIARAASVVRAIRADLPADSVSGAIQHLVGNTLIAQGHGPLQRSDASRLPEHYNPCYINADADLSAVAEGLCRARTGRLCLYGPPGTGKTAFGRWLSERLDVPLAVRRASDIVSPFLGVTEKNIAHAFRAAEREGAVLVLDEADSFLRDRRGAYHGWEVTQVNEMLTQIEGFGGVFIASTNLLDGLDAAALRRFDLKVRFGYLKPEQAWDLFVAQCAALGLEQPEAALRSALARLTVLTPGDFAAVARQHRFRPLTGPSALLDALVAECALKEDGKRSAIGFV